jgi:hypothetical protein
MADTDIKVPLNAPADFVSKIQGVLQKAKANGDSLLGFNTFVTNLWENYKNQQEQWQLKDVDGDGKMEWVNLSTKEVKPTGYGITGNEALINIEKSDNGSVKTDLSATDISQQNPDVSKQDATSDINLKNIENSSQESTKQKLNELKEFDAATSPNIYDPITGKMTPNPNYKKQTYQEFISGNPQGIPLGTPIDAGIGLNQMQNYNIPSLSLSSPSLNSNLNKIKL